MWLLLIFHWFCLTISAQPVKKFYFTHYTTDAGLLSTEINTVTQDERGFIWVGTVDGLQRFDGTRFQNFQHNPADPNSIPDNNVVFLLKDDQNRLWLLTARGNIGYFNTKTLRYTAVRVITKTQKPEGAAVKRLIKDESGHIFLLLGGVEVVTWDEKSNEFSWKNNFFEITPGTGVSDFAHQPGTPYYWIAGGKGVGIYNSQTRVLSYPGNNRERIPAVELMSTISIPYHLHFDQQGRLWFQSWITGLPKAYRFRLNDPKPVLEEFEFISLVKSYYETYRFFEQKDGSIWIGGLNLFARFVESENRFQLIQNGYLNERSISYERLTSIFEDREKNIWVGTDNNGLYRFNPSEQYFTNVAHTDRVNNRPGKGTVMSFISLKNGEILAGTWSDGLYQYDRNLNLLPLRIKGIQEMKSPTVWTMCASGDSNTIWMGAQPGIIELNQATATAKSYNPPQLENRTVRQVVEDRDGNLWLGMQNFGLFKWNAADKKARDIKKITRFEGFPVSMVIKITVDSKGLIWVASDWKGLYVIDPRLNKVIYQFSDTTKGAFRLPEINTYSVLEYNDSLMAIATTRNLLLFNRYTQHTTQIGRAGFMRGNVVSMEKDSRGYIWIATTSGLNRVNVKTRAFVGFNRSDGIDNDHFSFAASTRLPDGRLLFGSSTEFIGFNPDSMNISSTPPLPKITEFRVQNRSLLVDSLLELDRVELRYGSNSIEIGFSPLVFSSAFNILYKMEGIDPDWRIADKSNKAVYSYLPSGKYHFRMKTLDGEGQVSEVVSTLTIRIIPPFWKSWWFFCGLAVIIGLLFFWFDRERIRRKEAILKMRNNIADNLHHEVNAALNNINILSEMARLKAEKDPEKSKEYIEQIHSKSHNMIIAMDDMLWSLDPGNDSMEKTTDRMREYIDALKNRYGVNIDIAVDHKVETLPLNMKMRHDAFLVFKEGLKNLVTLGAENLHVYIKSDRSDLLFITLFDSEHCDMQQLNNLLHRQDLERRLSMIQASIEVDLHKSHSAITMRVPVS